MWLILGGGISGRGAYRLLTSKKELCLLLDRKHKEISAKYHIKCNPDSDLSLVSSELKGVIVSPGVKSDHPILLKAKEKKIQILSEIDLALQYFSGTLICVTGTNGKSTTASMIYHILAQNGIRAQIAGNIGLSLAQLISENKSPIDVLVLELSSYQIEYSDAIRPAAVVFTSFSQDHLEWHGTIKNYFLAKWKLTKSLANSGLLILDESVKPYINEYCAKLPECSVEYPGSETLIKSLSHKLLPHDTRNAIKSSYLVNKLFNLSVSDITKALNSFKFLPHRFEKFMETTNGFFFINDSKSTNVDSTLCALESLSAPAILMLGGRAKKESFSPIARYKSKIKRILCFGESRDFIASHLEDEFFISKHDNLKEAIESLKETSLTNDILLSPGCASFDEFNNFEDRGNFFKSYTSTVFTKN